VFLSAYIGKPGGDLFIDFRVQVFDFKHVFL
jgi:hypothetical protein